MKHDENSFSHTPIRVTLGYIARELGLSKSTVSLALRGNLRVKEETRQRVKEFADRVGYAADPVLARAASSRWYHREHSLVPLAFVTSDARPVDELTFWEIFQKQASIKGYQAGLYRVPPKTDGRWRERFRQMIEARGYECVIAAWLHPDHAEVLDWSKFYTVSCGGVPIRGVGHFVKSDEFYRLKLLWTKAVERGYRRIGFATLEHEPPIPEDEKREAMGLYFNKKAKEMGLETVPVCMCGVHDYKGISRWVKRYKPDAVLAMHAGVAHHLMEEEGVRIPEDMGFVTMTDTWKGEFSGVNMRVDVLGRFAVDLLDTLYRGQYGAHPEDPVELSVPPLWFEGESLPSRKG